ncbi:NAD(P)H-hydrate epimerase [Candidatus Woesearchaeota archaeon]|nr:NAD(P)H-hydrate epimerase [Candidatus Woesearchaeota archaeon]
MITSQQMRELEDYAESEGVLPEELMENAGRQVFQVIKERYEHELEHKRIIIFCGQGNNGGDGFVAARYFAKTNLVLIMFFGYERKLSEEARKMYDKVKKQVTIVQIMTKEDLDKFQVQPGLDLICLDALTGTGFNGPVRDPLSFAIDYFNSLPGIKIAVDVPSGLNADTGEAEKKCEVDLIVTFHDAKVGLQPFLDKVVVVDIVIPKSD